MLRGYKVTDAERRARVGIAARSLADLRAKTAAKFQLARGAPIEFQAQDGTLVDSDAYLATLPAHSLLVWVRAGERAATDAELLYRTIREVNEEYLGAGERVQAFFTEKMKSKVFKLAEVLRGIDPDRAKCSLRSEHPEWFDGVDSNAKTKEDYMFRRAQDRIRTYYYKMREELLKNAALPSRPVRGLVNDLHALLKLAKFNGFMFDRRAKAAICDEGGLFTCHGRWNKACCLYSPAHSINPYASREGRIVFQTWNLDHGVERSRAILPEIVRALTVGERERKMEVNCRGALDVKQIFNDLFTLGNLRLVHIVCHDKGAHKGKNAGPYLLA